MSAEVPLKSHDSFAFSIPFDPLLYNIFQCTAAFKTDHIEVIDFTDGACSGAKLEVIIVSEDFEGVPLIQRHRKVQALLKEGGLMDEAIHALTIKAWTPDQWETKK